MNNISKILGVIWDYLSNNAFLGAFVASLITSFIISYITKKNEIKNKIQALKKELETNEGLLRRCKKGSVEQKRIQCTHLHTNIFSKILEANLAERLGIENYAELICVYDEIKKMNNMTNSIETGLMSIKNLDIFSDRFIVLAENIRKVNNLIK